jgi:ADP-heptose:LPS heptosyltransferase
MKASRRRIAIWRLCGIGDAVQMTPLLQQIRADEPSAEVFCFLSANAVPALHGAPWIDHLIPLDLALSRSSWLNPGLARMWRFIAQHGPFDQLICLGGSWSNLILSRWVNAPQSAGFITEGWKPFPLFTHPYPVPADSGRDRKHESLKYLEVWQNISGHRDAHFGYALPHLGQNHPSASFALRTPYICFAPGVGNPFSVMNTKRWPVDRFAKLMTRAINAGYQVAVLGVAGDMPAQFIPPSACDLLSKTDLNQAASIIRHAAGFVGNDSGLFHLALGLETPALSFFGPTDAAKTGPFRSTQAQVLNASLPCSPCFSATCRALDQRPASADAPPPCMTALSVDDAWQALQALMASSAPLL